MPTFIVDSDSWTPRRSHGRPEKDVDGRYRFHQWALTDEGIWVQGEDGVRRTRGKPVTLGRIVADYGPVIAPWAAALGLSEPLLAAVITTESGGKAAAERHEPRLNDYSIGLMQTLTATAKQIMRTDETLPHLSAEPVPAGGSLEAWRGLLRQSNASIAIGGAYLRHQNRTLELQGDPVLLYCSYNAGSVKPSSKNSWGLGSYGQALDHFSRWYGDACAVYGAEA